MTDVRVAIIGAGVIGLAIAADLARYFTGVVVLEKNDKFGKEISSRNSEVIHAGLYYPSGSLKASLCVEGAALLYEYCSQNHIPHKKLGKLIVATSIEEEESLLRLSEQAHNNGTTGIRLITAQELRNKETSVKAQAALYSPNTGIIDSHRLLSSLCAEAQAAGATIAFGNEVTGITKTASSGAYRLLLGGGEEFSAKLVINCAGLGAEAMARVAGIDIAAANYRIYHCKGTYFSYAKPSPVGMLIYPVPQKHLTGLGIHATLNLAGRLRFGPDTEYIEEISYEIDEGKREDFFTKASRLIEGLDKDAFHPDLCGVRPKLGREEFRDFVITHEAAKGLAGFINLLGIESPGLTASLAIAKYVRKMVAEIGY